jgi:uncharacterized NAD(P)/FAD-binding protein YdhS
VNEPGVAIVGAGYSGTALAIALVRRGLAVTLIERSGRFASGAAYGTRAPEHLLNVRAAGMSAFAEDSAHFARWLEARGGAPTDFAERRAYHLYLREQLDAAPGDRLHLVEGEAVALQGSELLLADGTRLAAGHIVLALGNLPPATPPGLPEEVAASDFYRGDPWQGDLASGLKPSDQVVLIGTGLTAIDAILSLDAAGFGGRILSLSRRGLMPRPHASTPPAAPLEQPPAERGSRLLRRIRQDAATFGWRPAIDQLRPVTQAMWQRADAQERRRFLRHLRPWWDVHRHRIAPEVAAVLDLLQQEGRLTVAAGRLLTADLRDDGVDLAWRPRGSAATCSLATRRVVNCTGPRASIAGAEPLLDDLLGSRRVRPDPLNIGIDVDDHCRALPASGEADDCLTVVGPLTKGRWWEIVAVPDLRVQVEQVADRLALLPQRPH